MSLEYSKVARSQEDGRPDAVGKSHDHNGCDVDLWGFMTHINEKKQLKVKFGTHGKCSFVPSPGPTRGGGKR